MALDPDRAMTVLENQELPTVISLGGAERGLVDDAAALVRLRTLTGGLADFNHDRVTARERGARDIVALCQAFPVMAKRRLVEVHDVEAWSDADVDVLDAYVKSPAPDTVLLLVMHAVDLRTRLGKLLDKDTLLGRFEHPKEREMPGLVARRAKRHNLVVDDEVAVAVAVTVGTDLGLLERALEKLALVVGDERVVTTGLVAAHVADTHLEDAFGLARAVADRNRKAALQILGLLEASRDAVPIQLVGLLAWQLRQVARARALLDEGGRGDDVGRALSLFGDRLAPVLASARREPMVAHARALTDLAVVDRALKSSRQSPWLLLTRFILQVCPDPDARAGRPSTTPRR